MDKDKIEAFVSRGKKLTDTDWILVPAAISLGVSIFNIYYSDFHIVTIVFGCLSNMLSFLIYFLVKEKAKKKSSLILLYSGIYILIIAFHLYFSLYYSLCFQNSNVILLILCTILSAIICAGLEVWCTTRSIRKGKYLVKQMKASACVSSVPACAVGIWMFVQYWLKRNYYDILNIVYAFIFFFVIIACVYLSTFLLIKYYYTLKLDKLGGQK